MEKILFRLFKNYIYSTIISSSYIDGMERLWAEVLCLGWR